MLGTVVTTVCALGASYGLYRLVTSSSSRTNVLPASEERIVILGASSTDGIGIALARECLARGSYHIMLVARRSEALREVKHVLVEEQTTRSARERAEQIELLVADCSDPDDVYRLQQCISDDFGGVDTLYIVFGAIWTNTLLGVAGTDPVHHPHALTPSREGLRAVASGVQQSNDANIKGTALVLAALLPRLQTNSKAPFVVVIGSLASLVPAPTRSMYCATKVAQQMLVQSVATECSTQAKVGGRKLVKFAVLAPGTVNTSFRARLTVNASKNVSVTTPRHGKSLSTTDVAKEALHCVQHGVTGVVPIPHRYFWVWLLGPLLYVILY